MIMHRQERRTARDVVRGRKAGENHPCLIISVAERGFLWLRVTTSFPQLGAQTRKQQVRISRHHLCFASTVVIMSGMKINQQSLLQRPRILRHFKPYGNTNVVVQTKDIMGLGEDSNLVVHNSPYRGKSEQLPENSHQQKALWH